MKRRALLSTSIGLILSTYAIAGMPAVDILTFRGEEGKTVVDVFIKLTADSLVVSSEEGAADFVNVSFAVIVEDSSSGLPVLADRWNRKIKAPPRTEEAGEIYILDSSSMELIPGAYAFVVLVEDTIGERRFVSRKRVTIPSYDAPGLRLSDLLLTSSIARADSPGQFIRSGYRIAPNPDRRFGARSQTMYIYHEIYNHSAAPGLQDSFSVSYRVMDDVGRDVRVHEPVWGRREGDTSVRVAGLNIAGLAPGFYVISADVGDVRSGLRASKSAQFEIVAPRSPPMSQELTDEQVDRSLDVLTYIASARERALLESLDETGKRNFVRRYWLQHDGESMSPINEYFTEMMRRYDHANEEFSGHLPGWLTDRGRIYIMYGEPRDVERSIANPGTRDYEIWTYALEGETIFVFADERGYGQYRLVHSTARDEIQNPDWEEFVKLHGSDF